MLTNYIMFWLYERELLPANSVGFLDPSSQKDFKLKEGIWSSQNKISTWIRSNLEEGSQVKGKIQISY